MLETDYTDPRDDAAILDTLIKELGRLEKVCTGQSAAYERNGDYLSLVETRAELSLLRHIIGIVNH